MNEGTDFLASGLAMNLRIRLVDIYVNYLKAKPWESTGQNEWLNYLQL